MQSDRIDKDTKLQSEPDPAPADQSSEATEAATREAEWWRNDAPGHREVQ